MATNPMLQAVLLFQHHQTTTPFMPIQPVSREAMAKPQEEKNPPFDTEEDEAVVDDVDTENGENEENEEKQDG